jgi:integrase
MAPLTSIFDSFVTLNFRLSAEAATNLRHSLASVLVTKRKTDVKTVQRSMVHAKSTTMLDRYAQIDIDELIAAQERMLNATFAHAEGTVQ